MDYYFAPLEGITDSIYRRHHAALFSGVDKYFAPFISPTMHHSMTAKELRDILPSRNAGLKLVPQILTKNAEDFCWAAAELADMGYEEINLNLGCPSGTVTAKGKGAGFLADLPGLEAFLDKIFAAPKANISIKTRLGMEDPEEFEKILAVYNRYPVFELTVHPRVRQDMYKRPVRMAFFDYAVKNSENPLCYNGDLNTKGQCQAFAKRVPQVKAVMLGRGLIADPALVSKCKGLSWGGKESLLAFHNGILEEYRQAFGSDRNAMFRMKEIWGFHHKLFADSEKHWKKLRKTTDFGEYTRVVQSIFRDLELLPDTDLT